MTPAWILAAIAALMLVVAAVSAARLVAARPWRRGAAIVDTDVAHLLMAIAMAGMAVPGLGTLPDVAWEVIFGLLTAWFASGCWRTHGAAASVPWRAATALPTWRTAAPCSTCSWPRRPPRRRRAA